MFLLSGLCALAVNAKGVVSVEVSRESLVKRNITCFVFNVRVAAVLGVAVLVANHIGLVAIDRIALLVV